MKKITSTQAVFIAALLHIIACAYLYTIDTQVVMTGEMQWDSELGHILLTPFFLMVAYAWCMAFIVCLGLPKWSSTQVDPIPHERGQWMRTHSVLFLTKFSKLASIMAKH